MLSEGKITQLRQKVQQTGYAYDEFNAEIDDLVVLTADLIVKYVAGNNGDGEFFNNSSLYDRAVISWVRWWMNNVSGTELSYNAQVSPEAMPQSVKLMLKALEADYFNYKTNKG